MAEMRGSVPNNTSANWILETKNKARELRSSAQSAARDLFRSGDLRPYLDLVCRLNYYDAYNLLLLLQQYPKATCLAGFKHWQKQLPREDMQVLKPEWRGKGIDLIAPYTDFFQGGRFCLTWFAVKQFDISQTNVEHVSLPPSVYKPSDRNHVDRLSSCLCEVIAQRYHRSIIHMASSKQLRSAGLVGQMNEHAVCIRDDAKPAYRLDFLCQCICQLAMEPPVPLTPPQKDLAMQCIIYCLFRNWEVAQPRPLRQSPAILASFSPDQQLPFLSLIQVTVRLLEEELSYEYRAQRSREEEDAPPMPPDF